MSGIKLFENPSFGSVRVVMRGGDPWFVAADVCKCLAIANPSDALTRLDEDEKMLISCDLAKTEVASNQAFQDLVNQPRGFNVVSESGLYTLIIRSNKPEAKEFRRWVTHEVLPQIRKTGEYVVETVEKKPRQGTLPTALSDAMLILSVLYEGNQLALAADKIFVREHGYSALKTAEVQLIAPQQTQLYTPTEIGRQVEPPISAVKVNKILQSVGWQVKVNDKWEAVGDGVPYAVYLDTGKAHSDGTPIRQLKWTADVIFLVQKELNQGE